MHKQHPQTAYRKYAILIGTIFENCDRKDGQRMQQILILGGGAAGLAAALAYFPADHVYSPVTGVHNSAERVSFYLKNETNH